MYSLAFPNMFTSTNTSLYRDKDATLSNLKLLLKSERTNLFGDPYYGNNLHTIIYRHNNTVLKDLIVDDIYSAIQKFMPQIDCSRNDIIVKGDKTRITVTLTLTNRLDKTTNLYEIDLITAEES